MKQVKIYQRAQGIIEAYEKTLTANKIAVMCLSNNYTAVIGDYFDNKYVARIKELGIEMREILPDTMGNREDSKRKPKNLVRFIGLDMPSESDFILYDDKAMLVSFDPNSPMALEITDRNIVSNLRTQYEELWRRL